MPVIAPSRPLQVMPVAATPHPGLSAPLPDPAAGMALFEQAAKLPLLMEQIKMEKVRQKAEKAKLDLAEMDANYKMQNFEKLAQQQQALAQLGVEDVLAGIELKRAQAGAATLNAQTAALQNTPVSPVTGQPLAPAPQVATPGPITGDTLAIPAEAPLAAETVAPAAPAPAAAPAAVPVQVGGVALPVILEGVNKDAFFQELARQAVEQRMSARYGRAVPLRQFRENIVDEKAKLVEELRPKPGVFEFQAPNGIPMKVKATMIGSQPVELLEKPVADLETYYKLNPVQKKVDDIVAEQVGPMLTGGADRKLESNLQNLAFAKQILADSSVATGSFVSMLPDAVRSRIPGLQRGISARDAVRNVVQQTLRETLGAQFARVEGEMMMERAFDARMPEAENIRRINLLADEVVNYAKAKGAAADYLRANGTMAGYTGITNFDMLADAMKAKLEAAYGSPAENPGVSQAGSLATGWAQRKRG